MKYILEDFQNIYTNNPEQFNLNNYNELIIESLCNDLNIIYNKNLIKKTLKKKKKSESDEWENLRNFKITNFNKGNTECINLQNCRKYLNMLTENNFTIIFEKISIEIDYVIKNKTQNDLNNICENIFILICNNTLYSNLYSKLFVYLNNKYNEFFIILKKYINNYNDKINLINYIDPQLDYNLYCENNKKNDILKAETILYTNLVKDSILSIQDILSCINFIIENFKSKLILENFKKVNEEYSEIIYILISQLYPYFDNEYKNYIDLIIKEICNYKNSNYPSFSSKILFKFIDIKEECKIN